MPRSKPALDSEPAAEAPVTPVTHKTPTGKLAILAALLSRPEGADLDSMMAATGWQAHSVRGAMSGGLKTGCGLTIESEKIDGHRVWRIKSGEAAQ